MPFAFFAHICCPPEEEGSTCQSALHRFPSSVPRPCIFQPPCQHTADLLTAFPSCCLFSFDLILFIFTPLRDSFLFCSELVHSFYSLFSYPGIFSPIFLSSFFSLTCSLVHPSASPQPSFPFFLCISSDPQAIYLIACSFFSFSRSFHLLMSFLSKQQRSIRYLFFFFTAAEVSQGAWRRKRDIETVMFT